MRPFVAAVVALTMIVAACSGADADLDGAPTTTERPGVTEVAPTPVTTSLAPSPTAEPEATATEPEQPLGVEDFTVPPVFRDLIPLLVRIGSEVEGVEIEILYEPDFLLALKGEEEPSGSTGGPTAIFTLSESVHTGELPTRPPDVVMLGAGDELIEPVIVLVLNEDLHHRSTRLVFPVDKELDPRGEVDATQRSVSLALLRDGIVSDTNVFLWRLPLSLTAKIIEDLANVEP